MPRQTKIIPTVTLANNGVTYIFDSTAGLTRTPASTAGPVRGKFAGYRISGNVGSTDQNVTLRLDYLQTDGTWQTGVSSTTITAGTPQDFDFLPRAPEWRAVLVNGAAGPTTLFVDAYLVEGDRSAGV